MSTRAYANEPWVGLSGCHVVGDVCGWRTGAVSWEDGPVARE